MRRSVIVVGAGPAGLAAAHACLLRGFEVTVLEQGEIGAALRRYGPTRFFTPLSMNVPPAMLEAAAGRVPADALLTGPELATKVLAPFVHDGPLAGRVRTGQRVLAVGRAGMTRGDFPGHPLRGERPFELLVESRDGECRVRADVVLDASGTYGNPVALGAGGLPAVGERVMAAHVLRDLDALDARRSELRGATILLAGCGHSAANALGVLRALCEAAPQTRVVWVVRSANARPCVDVAGDPLPERRRVVRDANDLAQRPPEWLRVERRAAVYAIRPSEAIATSRRPTWCFSLSADGAREAHADLAVALVGYRPDLSLVSELALEISPATEGSARLARALASVTDCLSVPTLRPDDLASGEPGFHFVGSKSYGRARTFLLQNGYAQVDAIVAGLG